MSDTVSGIVESVDVRETNAGTMYNIKVNGKSFGYGRYPPKAKAGDSITFGVKYNGQYANVDTKNVQVTPGTGAPPQKSFTSAPSNDAGKNTYWENKEKLDLARVATDAAKQITIERQAALNSAIAFANVIVGANLVPTPANAKPKDVVAIIESMVLHYRDVFLATSTEKPATATAPTAEPDPVDEETTGW